MEAVKISQVIIPFDGSGDFAAWIERFELVLDVQGHAVADRCKFLPAFLADGAFAVYLGVEEQARKDYALVKEALMAAFAADKFRAFEDLVGRRLQTGESVAVYAASLKRLAAVVSPAAYDDLQKCAVIAGLPADIRKQLRAACSLDKLAVSAIVEKAQALIQCQEGSCAAASVTAPSTAHVISHPRKRMSVICWTCRGEGHISRNCPGKLAQEQHRFCFLCGNGSHVASACPDRAMNTRPKKHARGSAFISAGAFPRMMQRLPSIHVRCGNRLLRALLDTGCSRSIIAIATAERLADSCAVYSINEPVTMMNGGITHCYRACCVTCVVQGAVIELDCLVSAIVQGYDMLLGMDAVEQLGGVSVGPDGSSVMFKCDSMATAASACNLDQPVPAASSAHDVRLVDKDFTAAFSDGKWIVKWQWKGGDTSPTLTNRVEAYRIPEHMQAKYDAEIQEWIRCGWLQPFSGQCDGVIPLMAVFQSAKDKVRPVLDYRELNQYVSSHTAASDVCSDKLRAWRRMGRNVSIIDLRKAYLQLHVDPSLWKYQVVVYNGQRYCLTRLGFGLNVAPKIMTAVLSKVLSVDALVRAGTDSYIDDVIVNTDIVSTERVLSVLQQFGLEAKPPENVIGGRVLGLRVIEKDGDLLWKRDTTVDQLSQPATRRQLFSWCGQLVGHFPVVGWLRPACSYVKRATSDLAWDAPVSREVLQMAQDISQRVTSADPVTGIWTVPSSSSGQVWCDASSLAIGACVQIGGRTVEDASWLRKADDCSHINLAELEAVIKGLNLALAWNLREVELFTDSATVFAWLRSLVDGDRPIRTRGLGEALARRRMAIIGDVIKEYELRVHPKLIRSSENKADALTRVPQSWLKPTTNMALAAMVQAEPPATATPMDEAQLRRFHDLHHLGVDRTLYLARVCFPDVTVQRQQVESVVRSCVRCRSVDPAPIAWTAGHLDVETNWYRLATDVTWFRGAKYLTLVDSGPSRFAIWRRLPDERETSVVRHLEEVFRERGPPWQLLMDNSATFKSGAVRQLCDRWGVRPLYRCAYRSAGNGIVERNHRTIKGMAARSGRDVLMMVYWYNLASSTGLDASSAPSRQTFTYNWKPPMARDPLTDDHTNGDFFLGQRVFVKPDRVRCTTEWPQGTVTAPVEGVGIEIDCVRRHLADIRTVPPVPESPLVPVVADPQQAGRTASPNTDSEVSVRVLRPRDSLRPPIRYSDYQLSNELGR